MIRPQPGGFDLLLDGRTVLKHRPEAPCLFVGHGNPIVAMYRGNFDLEDRVDERIPLRHAVVAGLAVAFHATADGPALLRMELEGEDTDRQLRFIPLRENLNRFWLHLHAEPGEHVWGAGEQMSHLALRGRRFPLWTSEPGVGRDKTTLLTWQADVAGRAGGDYWTTNYPQPTFLSSRRYAFHADTTAFAAFDFRRPDRHEVELWEVPARVEFWARPNLSALVSALAARFGHPPALPEWVYNGAIIGLKDGERSFERLDAMCAAGVQAAALWCEDWVGLRHTSFGARLFWDWRASDVRYPALRARIAALRDRDIRFLGYVNPYLCGDGVLFAEAEAAGYFATDASGGTALVDFGEFDCGVVDFTNPAAAAWFAERVLGQNMLDIGLSGWMADFGEYLPTDLRLRNGDPMLLHNAWPALWAAVNARAVASRNSDALFFMRAGWTGVQRHCPLLWGGDQSVDWTRHDGLPSAICGALSSGLVGNTFHHSDIGGYTSLFGNVRTPELFMRWAEMAAFTPVMRTHEGNRPRDNVQADDPSVLPHFARMTRVWVHLVPYLRAVVAEAVATGLPAQRPLFLHFESDGRCAAIQDAYLYGPDLLVAPVLQPGVDTWTTYLPGSGRLDASLVRPNVSGRHGRHRPGPARPSPRVRARRNTPPHAVRRAAKPVSAVIARPAPTAAPDWTPAFVIVSDAAPLIHLAAGNALDLLQAMGRVVVPDVVRLEVTRLAHKPFAREIIAWFARHVIEVPETEIGDVYRLAIEHGMRPPRHAGELSIVEWLADTLGGHEAPTLVVADDLRVTGMLSRENLPGPLAILTTRSLIKLAEESTLIESADMLWSRIKERAPTANPFSIRTDLQKPMNSISRPVHDAVLGYSEGRYSADRALRLMGDDASIHDLIFQMREAGLEHPRLPPEEEEAQLAKARQIMGLPPRPPRFRAQPPRTPSSHPSPDDQPMTELPAPRPTRPLHRDGPDVSSVAWGMWRFAGADLARAQALVEAVLAAGVTLFDTADIYGFDGPGFGTAEELFGRVLAAQPGLRDRMVIATKGGITPPTPYNSGAAYLSAAIDASLRRMGVDRVELYQVHRRDLLAHPQEVARTLDDARRAGKVGAIGVSNHAPAEVDALQAFLPVPLVSTQPEFSPLAVAPLTDGVLDQAMARGMAVLAWSPLGGGRLGNPADGRATAVAAALDKVAGAYGVSRAAAAYSWIMAHPAGIIPITGTQTPARIAEIPDSYKPRWTRQDWYDVLVAARGENLP